MSNIILFGIILESRRDPQLACLLGWPMESCSFDHIPWKALLASLINLEISFNAKLKTEEDEEGRFGILLQKFFFTLYMS